MMRRTGLVLALLVALVMMPTRLMAQSLDELYQQADVADSARNYVEFENVMRKGIQLYPNEARFYYGLGIALRRTGKLEEAIAAYRQAIKLKPDDADAYINMGNALSDQKKLEDAIAAYRQAIRLKPDYAYAYNNLGLALYDQKKLEEAIAAYLKALSLPEDTSTIPTTAHTLAHNNLGWIYQQQGKLKEALAEYESALKIDPKFEYAKNNRDAVLALLEQPIELAYTDTNYLRLDDPLTRPKRAVVLLTPLFQSQGRGGLGTGFIIKRTDNKLWILTNRHVLTDPSRTCDSVEVQIYPGDKPSNARIAVLTSKTILIANNLDLALIELEAPQLPLDIQALPLSDPSDNQPITTIGHPDKNPWQKDQGKVIDVDDEKLRLSIGLAIGSSGSPVMTENYGVIGIIYKIDQEGTGYAIPINQIRQQLATWKVQLP